MRMFAAMKHLAALLPALVAATICADACTSMIVCGRASDSGRPLLWKHRDTGADNNFIERVEATDSTFGYVGLFNAGDSTLSEAWMGMNDAGLAIMNTASYNLMPDTAAYKDREGAVMSLALARCRTVDDFEGLLESLPKPMGVQANFGVIDASGGAAYFETSDHEWTRIDAGDTPPGVLIRTNYSVTGMPEGGMGYIRYNTAAHLADEAVKNGCVSPELFTETLSRSYYHSLTGHDYMAEDEGIVANLDFIPRDISTSSIVVEGVNSTDSCSRMVMWAALGYPPCAAVKAVTLTEIPDDFRPSPSTWRSEACDRACGLFRTAVPYSSGSGPKYVDLHILRPIIEQARSMSADTYRRLRH